MTEVAARPGLHLRPTEPVTSRIAVSLEWACRLATGFEACPPRRPTPPPMVPRYLMVLADGIAAAVVEDLQVLGRRRDELPSGMGGTVLRLVVDLAISDARMIERRIRFELERDLRSEALAGIDCPWMNGKRSSVTVAIPFLEVLAGERPYADSQAAAIDRAFVEHWYDNVELAVSTLPIVGPLYDCGMAVYGKTLYGRQRTPLERCLLGAGALIGPLAELLARGARVTARAVLLVKLNKFGTVGRRLNTLWDAMPVAVGTRALREPHRVRILELAAKLERGAELTPKETIQFNFLLSRMEESARVGAWTSYLKRTRNAAEIKGRHIFDLPGTELKPGEKAAAQIVARELNEQVVHLPKMLAEEVAAGLKATKLEGVKMPDVLIGRELADIATPDSTAVTAFLSPLEKKSHQGGTVIANLTSASFTARDLEMVMPRYWGKPGALDVHRVIAVEKGGVTVFRRPFQFDPLEVVGASPIGATAAQLAAMFEDAQGT